MYIDEPVDRVPLKNYVRPLSVVYVLALFTFVIIADGNLGNFTIKPGYYSMIETVVVTVVLGFFGMRGIEKTAREWQRNDYRHGRDYSRKPKTREPIEEDEE